MQAACDNPNCKYHCIGLEVERTTFEVAIVPSGSCHWNPKADLGPRSKRYVTLPRMRFEMHGKSGWFCSPECAREELYRET